MKSLPAPSRVILTAVGTAVTKTVSRAAIALVELRGEDQDT